jgi:hypothetical protein
MEGTCREAQTLLERLRGEYELAAGACLAKETCAIECACVNIHRRICNAIDNLHTLTREVALSDAAFAAFADAQA